MKNLKQILILSLIGLVNSVNAQAAYGEIRGKITNTDGKTVPFATIKIVQADLLVGGTQSDENGNYVYKPLTPGSYDMYVSDPEHQTQPIKKIKIIPNDATYLNVELNINTLATVTVTAPEKVYVQGGVDKNMYSMTSIDAKDLLLSAGYERGDIKGMLSNLTSNAYSDNKGNVYVRGSRSDATAYYVDGCRTLGPTNVAGLAVENLTFFSGGVPAMYGDLMGGAVIVTTKSYFSGLREKNIRRTAYLERLEAKKLAQSKE
ncbi:MAG: carboxypeptidase regulatory-like domain-containing protein [Bacteroidota bacterium]|jgi:hypothetical protein|nr:carboxypeptidase regulatory-like domain-containing protein [Bacteroidota bacterium]MCA6442457.1 carboxypeptidase regulatory-like domain-containing protein [Bacteroidota bacterium]